ncbi:uncharacterized protein [Nicotiana tomentosiformis]|uniref:uncharacterized protein n=1 Tax=Nicotiana tomentosiformis TaxID=4098 RepID=UPI00388CECB4
MHKTLRVMHAIETYGVELASYRLKGVAYSWFELWEESREEGSSPVRWGEFTDAFMDHFLPAETKAAHAAEFKSLKQGSMNVWEYHIEFAHLSKYAIHTLPTMEARVRWFVQGLSPLVMNEASTTALNSDMNYGKMVAFSQATETHKLKSRMERQSSSKARSANNFGGSSGGGGGRSAFKGVSSGPSQSFAQYLMGAQSSRPSQGNRGPHQQGRPDRRIQKSKETGSEISFQTAANVARWIEVVLAQERGQGSDERPRHSGGFSGTPSEGKGIFSRGHPPRPYHSSLQASHSASGGCGPDLPHPDQLAYTAPPDPISSPPLQSFKGGYLGRQGQFQGQQSKQPRSCYTYGDSRHIARFCTRAPGSLEQQCSRAMVPALVASPPTHPARGIVSVFHRDALVLFDPGSTYSYVSSYFASYLVVSRDSLSAPMYVSTLVGDSFSVDRVYRLCEVTIGSLETSVDLLLLDMVDFDVILGMDWLPPDHAILDCHAKMVTLAVSGFP